MLSILAIANLVLLLAVLLVVLLRKPTSTAASEDPQLTTTLARSEARGDALDQHLRAELAQLRTDTAQEAERGRDAANAASAALRNEVLGNINTLGDTLRTGLKDFRGDNNEAAERLRLLVEGQLGTLTQRFTTFNSDALVRHNESREALHTSLAGLETAQAEHQEKLRATVEERLTQLNQANAAKLEEMRLTVDEKLRDTLQTRLTVSFGAVTDQLTKLHAGLGEMNKLSAGIDDLSRIFTNVKSRGQFAEAMLDNLLKQMLAPGQFVRNARIKPETQEVVEFAVRFPGPHGDVLLPIDSKFPRESSDRLETAYDSGSAAEIAAARKVFDNAIRIEAKRICSKYINEPITTPNAILFLPTEGLYAEVMRRDGLHDDIQQNCHVMIAGPSNLAAILTSFQMVFQLVNLQKKGSEVWNVLAAARSEFGKFGILMDKMDKQVGTVQNTIRDVATRTRAINRTLRDVSADSTTAKLESGAPAGAFDGLLPMLAAGEDE